MSDDVTANPGVGGATFAADDIGGVMHPRIKLQYGDDGSATDVSSSNPLPVLDQGSNNGLTNLLARVSGSRSFAPHYDNQNQGGGPLSTDPANGLVTRSTILTDEGTFRVNFANSSLAVAATPDPATFTNGASYVQAISISSTFDLHSGDYIKLDADGEASWAQVDDIDGTIINLTAPYSGTTTTGAWSRALVRPYTGSGGSIAVASGQLTLTSGATNAATTGVKRVVDYAPLVFRSRLAISQRIANQTIYAGMREDAATPRWFARFEFDGAVNTTVRCATGRNPTTGPSASEQETTTPTIPNGATTATAHDYRIELLTESVRFYIDGILVAQHVRVIPAQHDDMTMAVEVVNGTGASSTVVTVDYLTGKNHDKIEIGVMSDSEQMVNLPPNLDRTTYNVAGVIAINTVLMLIDCSRYKSLLFQCTSMGTTGVVTPEWSMDGATWVGDAFVSVAGAGANTFNAAGMWLTNVKGRYFRLRLSTATTAGTTTIYLDACAVRQQYGYVSQTVTATNLSCNVAQVAGQIPLNPATNGSTNRALVAALAGPVSNTDYSAQAWAAASGSGATIADANGTGLGAAFDVNLTAWTAGASTGLVVFLQESPDNGTTWYDIWQCETLTAVSRARIPALPIGGRRRMRWVNLSGAATTATVTVTAMDLSQTPIKQVQWFDRTASVTSGTAAAGNGASFDIAACKALTFLMQTGTATAPASFKIQMSLDGTNWYDASTATSCPASSMTLIPLTAGVYGRFGRFVCTAGGTSALVSAGHVYGTN